MAQARAELKSIAAAMRNMRRQREKTLEEVSDSIRANCGMRAYISQLSNIENAKSSLSLKMFRAYAQAIDVPASELLRAAEIMESRDGK